MTGATFAQALVSLASRPLEARDALRPVDAIVVLGSPLLPGGSLSRVARERIELGCTLFQRGIGHWLVVTGGSLMGPPEAPAMAAFAIAAGVDESRILVEASSKTTAENARLTRPLLERHAIESVVVVSQPFHTRRARRLFRRQGFQVIAYADATGIQHREPLSALQWIGREYAAWCKHVLLGD